MPSQTDTNDDFLAVELKVAASLPCVGDSDNGFRRAKRHLSTISPAKGFDVLSKRNMQQAIFYRASAPAVTGGAHTGGASNAAITTESTFYKIAAVDSRRNVVMIHSGYALGDGATQEGAGTERAARLTSQSPAYSALSCETQKTQCFWDPEMYLRSDIERHAVLQQRSRASTAAAGSHGLSLASGTLQLSNKQKPTCTIDAAREPIVGIIPVHAEDEGFITCVEFLTLPGFGTVSNSAGLPSSPSFSSPEHLLLIGTSTGCVIIASICTGVNHGLPSPQQAESRRNVTFNEATRASFLLTGRIRENEQIMHNSVLCILKCNDNWCRSGRLPEDKSFLLNPRYKMDFRGAAGDASDQPYRNEEGLNEALRAASRSSPNDDDNAKGERRRLRDRIRDAVTANVASRRGNATPTAESGTPETQTPTASGPPSNPSEPLSPPSSMVRKFVVTSFTPDVRNNPSAMKSSNTAAYAAGGRGGGDQNAYCSTLRQATIDTVWIVFSDGFMVPLCRSALATLCKGIAEVPSWWGEDHAASAAALQSFAAARIASPSSSSPIPASSGGGMRLGNHVPAPSGSQHGGPLDRQSCVPTHRRPRLISHWHPKTTATPFAFCGISTLDEHYFTNVVSDNSANANVRPQQHAPATAARGGNSGTLFPKHIVSGFSLRSGTHQVSGDDAGTYVETLIYDAGSCARINSDPMFILDPSAASEQCLVVVGSAPCIATVSMQLGAQAEVSATQVITEVANKLTSAAMGFIRTNFWGRSQNTSAASEENETAVQQQNRKTIDQPLNSKNINPFISLGIGAPPQECATFTSVEVDPTHRFAACYTPLGRIYIYDLLSGTLWRIIKNCRAAECCWTYPVINGRKTLLLAVHLNFRGVIEFYSMNRRRRAGAVRVGPNCTVFRSDGLSKFDSGALLLLRNREQSVTPVGAGCDVESDSDRSFSSWDSSSDENSENTCPTDVTATTIIVKEIVIVTFSLKAKAGIDALKQRMEEEGNSNSCRTASPKSSFISPLEKFKFFAEEFENKIFFDEDESGENRPKSENQRIKAAHSLDAIIGQMLEHATTPLDFMLMTLAMPVPLTSLAEVHAGVKQEALASQPNVTYHGPPKSRASRWPLHLYFFACTHIHEQLKSRFRPAPNDDVVIVFPPSLSPINVLGVDHFSAFPSTSDNQLEKKQKIASNYVRAILEYNSELTASQIHNFLELRLVLLKVFAEAGGRSSPLIRKSLSEMLSAAKEVPTGSLGAPSHSIGLGNKGRWSQPWGNSRPQRKHRLLTLSSEEVRLKPKSISAMAAQGHEDSLCSQNNPLLLDYKSDAFYASALYGNADFPLHGPGAKGSERSLAGPFSATEASNAVGVRGVSATAPQAIPSFGITSYLLAPLAGALVGQRSTKGDATSLVVHTDPPEPARDPTVSESAMTIALKLNTLWGCNSKGPNGHGDRLDPHLLSLCTKLVATSATCPTSPPHSPASDAEQSEGTFSLQDFLVSFWCGSYKIRCIIESGTPSAEASTLTSPPITRPFSLPQMHWHRQAKVRLASLFYAGTTYASALVALSHLGISAQSAADLFCWWFIHDVRSQASTGFGTLVSVAKSATTGHIEDAVGSLPLFLLDAVVAEDGGTFPSEPSLAASAALLEEDNARRLQSIEAAFACHHQSLAAALTLLIVKADQMADTAGLNHSQQSNQGAPAAPVRSNPPTADSRGVGSAPKGTNSPLSLLTSRLATVYGLGANELARIRENVTIIREDSTPLCGENDVGSGVDSNFDKAKRINDLMRGLTGGVVHSEHSPATFPIVASATHAGRPLLDLYLQNRFKALRRKISDDDPLRGNSEEQLVGMFLAACATEVLSTETLSRCGREPLTINEVLCLGLRQRSDVSTNVGASVAASARDASLQSLVPPPAVIDSVGGDEFTRSPFADVFRDDLLPLNDITLLFSGMNPTANAVDDFVRSLRQSKTQLCKTTPPYDTASDSVFTLASGLQNASPSQHFSDDRSALFVSQCQFETWMLCQRLAKSVDNAVTSTNTSAPSPFSPSPMFVLRIDCLDEMSQVILPLLARLHHKSLWAATNGARMGATSQTSASPDSHPMGDEGIARISAHTFDCLLILATALRTASKILAPLRAAISLAHGPSEAVKMETLQELLVVSPTSKEADAARPTSRDVNTYLAVASTLCEFTGYALATDASNGDLMKIILSLTMGCAAKATGIVLAPMNICELLCEFIRHSVTSDRLIGRAFSCLTREHTESLRSLVSFCESCTRALGFQRGNMEGAPNPLVETLSEVCKVLNFVRALLVAPCGASAKSFDGTVHVEWDTLFSPRSLSLLEGDEHLLPSAGMSAFSSPTPSEMQLTTRRRYDFLKMVSEVTVVSNIIQTSGTLFSQRGSSVACGSVWGIVDSTSGTKEIPVVDTNTLITAQARSSEYLIPLFSSLSASGDCHRHASIRSQSTENTDSQQHNVPPLDALAYERGLPAIHSELADATHICMFTVLAKRGLIREAASHWDNASTSPALRALASIEVLRLWVFNILYFLRSEISSACATGDAPRRTHFSGILAGVETRLIGHMSDWISISELEVGAENDYSLLSLRRNQLETPLSRNTLFVKIPKQARSENAVNGTSHQFGRTLSSISNMWLADLLGYLHNHSDSEGPHDTIGDLTVYRELWENVLAFAERLAHDAQEVSRVLPRHIVERVTPLWHQTNGRGIEEFDVEPQSISAALLPLWVEIRAHLR